MLSRTPALGVSPRVFHDRPDGQGEWTLPLFFVNPGKRTKRVRRGTAAKRSTAKKSSTARKNPLFNTSAGSKTASPKRKANPKKTRSKAKPAAKATRRTTRSTSSKSAARRNPKSKGTPMAAKKKTKSRNGRRASWSKTKGSSTARPKRKRRTVKVQVTRAGKRVGKAVRVKPRKGKKSVSVGYKTNPRRRAAAKRAAATRKRNALARSNAARKAARTRKRNTSSPARRRKNPARSVATKEYRSLATRRREAFKMPGRSRVKSRAAGGAPHLYSGATRKSRWGTRAYAKGVRSVLYQSSREHAKRGAALNKLMGSSPVRVNPFGRVLGTLQVAAPYVVSLLATRKLSAMAQSYMPAALVTGSYDHRGPIAALGMIAIGAYAVPRVGLLARYANPIMISLGINAVEQLVVTYMPASIKSMVGLGAYAEMGEYVGIGEYEADMGEYVGIGAEEDLGEYVGVGAEEDLGAYAEMGDGAFLSQGIGQGIGMPTGMGMRHRIPDQRFQRAVPDKSFTQAVPEVGPGFDSAAALYSGIFGR